ncbi:MAG: hypothetical protein H6738_16540 [Alphaproteobacteria bacterium]|nr:hypothetical protein [Alphaproteobacteria bacterium]MCB9698390.1 hypothetical protein [Alphaproteobacteria bacterium]
MFLLLSACSGPDLVADCSGEWPARTCAGGCADPEAQRWADGYVDHVADAWGVSRATTEEHLEVWSVQVEGTPSRYATLQVLFTSGWVAALYEVRADLPGPPASAADAKAAFASSGAPQVDPTAKPRPWREVSAFLDDCAAEHGVSFGGWCRTYLTDDPGDDDQAGVRFDFDADLGGGEYVRAYVYAYGSEPDVCDTNQVTID